MTNHAIDFRRRFMRHDGIGKPELGIIMIRILVVSPLLMMKHFQTRRSMKIILRDLGKD